MPKSADSDRAIEQSCSVNHQRRSHTASYSVLLPLVGLACFLNGCLFVHSNTHILREHEKIRVVQFETDQARYAYESGVNELVAHQKPISGGATCIPFICLISNETKLSDSAIYNDQEPVCDTNGDGVISQEEALAYRNRITQQLAADKGATQPAQAGVVQTAATTPAPVNTQGETTVAQQPTTVH
jgi:hypothetical protein